MAKTKETILNYGGGTQHATTTRHTDHEDQWELFTEREVHKRLFEKLFGPPHKVYGQGSVWYVDYDQLSIRRRKRSNLTEQQRAEIATRLRAGRESTKPPKARKPIAGVEPKTPGTKRRKGG